MLNALKKRYFDIVSKEDYPRTAAISKEADELEKMIRSMTSKDNPETIETDA